MDSYDPAKTFSSIDQQGRYAFANQGPIGLWNLTRFAETLLPLLDNDSKRSVAVAESCPRCRSPTFITTNYKHVSPQRSASKPVEPDDWDLVQSLLTTMADGEADFTLVFRHLSDALESGNDEASHTSVQSTDGIDRLVDTVGVRDCATPTTAKPLP